jgi:hypothetical protein
MVSKKKGWAVGYYFKCIVGPVREEQKSYSCALIEHWNGAAWKFIETAGNPSENTKLNGVYAITDRNVWVVGSLSKSPGTSIALIEHWDGRKWTTVAHNIKGNSSLSSVYAISANDIWAVGTVDSKALIIHWDGKEWTTFQNAYSTAESFLTSVSAHASYDVWAVGYSGKYTISQHWDGKKWIAIQTK